MTLRLFRAFALVWVLSCRTPSAPTLTPPSPVPTEAAPPAPEPLRLTLVATNDVHGWVLPHTVSLPDGQVAEEGGLSTFAGYLQVLRKENPGGVLLFDGGDLFQGTLAANLSEGAVVIEAFNQLGYAAAALGNHEFDYGPQGPVATATQPGQDPFGALKARFQEARFPLLAANIYDATTGARPSWLPNDGTTLLEVKGLRIGVLGLITPQTPFTTNPVNVASLRFGSLVPEAQAAAQRLRERGADLVIALAHAGGKCASHASPEDLSTCDVDTGEIWELLEKLSPGTLDAVVAGHTHSLLAHRVNGTPIVETEALARSFALIDLWVDPTTRKVLPERTQLTPRVSICEKVEQTLGECALRAVQQRAEAGEKVVFVPAQFRGHPIVRDPTLDRLLAQTQARVDAEEKRPLGLRVPQRLGRNYEAESALGSFLADSLREMEGADVALLNSGGLRDDLPAGELRYGDVYEVLPFDNTVATLTVTGEELRRLLLSAYGARKGVFQVSGLQLILERCPGQGRLRSVTLASTGRPPEPHKRYKVIVPDFLARGGDGLGAVLASLPPGRIDLGVSRELNFREALIAFWQKRDKPLVAPVLGRTTILPTPALCPGASPSGPGH